jgi:hypothetical protein
VLDLLERRFLPGLSEHIVAEHAIGPEHFRDVLNTGRGAAFSLQPTLFQSGWFRPHNRSPVVDGLYLVGAGTHPGAGVPAVLASGKIAAGLLEEDAAALMGTGAGVPVRRRLNLARLRPAAGTAARAPGAGPGGLLGDAAGPGMPSGDAGTVRGVSMSPCAAPTPSLGGTTPGDLP